MLVNENGEVVIRRPKHFTVRRMVAKKPLAHASISYLKISGQKSLFIFKFSLPQSENFHFRLRDRGCVEIQMSAKGWGLLRTPNLISWSAVSKKVGMSLTIPRKDASIT